MALMNGRLQNPFSQYRARASRRGNGIDWVVAFMPVSTLKNTRLYKLDLSHVQRGL